MYGKRFCTLPFNNCEVREGGNVYPCCISFTYYSFGNVYENTFDEIWNGERAQEFRRSILDESYKFCKLDKCNRYPNKNINNEFRDNASESGLHEIMDFPEKVAFAHENHCNVRCVMCRDVQKHNSEEETKKRNEKIDTVFLPMLKNAKFVFLNGNGEALASAHCRKLIKSISQAYPDIKFSILSNGLLCDEKNFNELGILDRLDRVIISFHAVTKKTYDTVVKDSNFEIIMKNIEWLSNSGGGVNLTFTSVISTLNYKEMIKFAKFAKKHDALVLFLEHKNFGTKINNTIDMQIFEKKHPEYETFVKILQHKIFQSENIFMPGLFKKLIHTNNSRLSQLKSIIIDFIYG